MTRLRRPYEAGVKLACIAPGQTRLEHGITYTVAPRDPALDSALVELAEFPGVLFHPERFKVVR